MRTIHPKLYDSYQKWVAEFEDVDYPGGNSCISIDQALRAHYLICDYFSREGEPIAAAGPMDKYLFLSAIDRQIVSFKGAEKWNDIFHRAATLFYGLTKNHSFFDGNKRTALLCALHQLLINRRIPTGSQRFFEKLAVDTAADRLHTYKRYSSFVKMGDPEVRTIAHFFKQNTRAEDRKFYVITFNHLRKILSKHGFEMQGPHHNHIDIVKVVEKNRFLGFGKTIERKLVAQVGCPRMTAEINQKALRTILRETELTPENGYDSQVIFNDADTLDALIDTYSGPLRRLRDK